MTLVRYNPLNDFVPGTFGDLIENVLRNAEKNDLAFRPVVDIFKDEKEIEVQLLLPGMKKEDFKIDQEENLLVVSGERQLTEEVKAKLQKRESYYGKFSKSFKLSDEIDQEKINASYTDGVLSIKLPLKEKKDTKNVIKVN